jgi:NAD(P)-dependent dehydrogenase (short-subunit alcohol dehydrogenase family)
MVSLKDKKFLITGASSGIGRKTAELIAEHGGTVVLFARREELLSQMIGNLKGNNHQYFAVDVTDDNLVQQCVKEAVTDGVPFSGFVHSAGMELTVPLKVLSKVAFEKAIMLNAFSAFYIAKVLLQKGNFSSSGGSFVFISSIMAAIGQPAKVGYSASKGALTSGAKAMALELAAKKIRVNTILPGMVETEMSLSLLATLGDENVNKIKEMHPLGLGDASDVSNTALFLLSDLSKWITGTSIIVDGGYSAA